MSALGDVSYITWLAPCLTLSSLYVLVIIKHQQYDDQHLPSTSNDIVINRDTLFRVHWVITAPIITYLYCLFPLS